MTSTEEIVLGHAIRPESIRWPNYNDTRNLVAGGGATILPPSRHFKVILLGLMASVGLAGAWARADFINFDPDGGNNPNGTGSLPATTISGFDQAVGNALAVGGNAVIANFVAGAYAGCCRFLRQL